MFAQSLAEEFPPDRDTKPLGGGSRTGRRFDAEAGDAGSNEILEQVSIVGSDLDHQALAGELKLPDDFLRIARRVGKPANGGAGEIGVVRAEQVTGLSVVLCLDQPAAIADFCSQGEILFRSHQICGGQIGIGGWRKAEVEERMGQRRAAVAAIHNATPLKSSSSMRWRASLTDSSAIGTGQAMASFGSAGLRPRSAADA